MAGRGRGWVAPLRHDPIPLLQLRAFLEENGAPSYAAARKACFLELAVALLRAVEHLHKASILHRDIKPENVLVPKDKAGLYAFALACLFDYDTARNPLCFSSEKEKEEAIEKAAKAGRKRPRPRLTAAIAKRVTTVDQRGTHGYSIDVMYGKPWDLFSVGVSMYEVLRGACHELFEECADKVSGRSALSGDLTEKPLYNAFIRLFKEKKNTTFEPLEEWLKTERALADLGGSVAADARQVALIARLVHPKQTAEEGGVCRMTAEEALRSIGEEPDATAVPEYQPRMPLSALPADMRAAVRAEVAAYFHPGSGLPKMAELGNAANAGYVVAARPRSSTGLHRANPPANATLSPASPAAPVAKRAKQ